MREAATWWSSQDTARETRHTGLVKNELDLFNKAWYYQNRGTNIKSHAHTTEFHLQNVPREAPAKRPPPRPAVWGAEESEVGWGQRGESGGK